MIAILRNGGDSLAQVVSRRLRLRGSSNHLPATAAIASAFQQQHLFLEDHRYFSSNNNNNNNKKKKKSFRPKRRSSESYRPIRLLDDKQLRRKKKLEDWSKGNDHKFVDLGHVNDNASGDELEGQFGPLAASVIKQVRKEMSRNDSLDDTIEEYLRLADYMVSEAGSTEDLVGERRALAEAFDNLHERDEFMNTVDELIREGRMQNMGLSMPGQDDGIDNNNDEDDDKKKKNKMKTAEELFGVEENTSDERDPEINLDQNQLAHGDWSEMLVSVDRNIKLWRGGRLESYRALVVGGNLNGCGGFGIGKALDPLVAVDVAGRHCKRNIFFVDRYNTSGLTRDLVGKQNSCVVTLRATDNGLRGNELIREILKRFGITDCVSKSHGNRNPYNIVRATFKALQTHESLEDIALKRGKRLVSVERAMRMQV